MKKNKRIKISAPWDSSENLTERLLRQFKTPKIDLTNVEFVYDESYDIIVFFTNINTKIKEGVKSYVFPHEPSWSGSHQKTFSSGTTVFGFDKKLYNGNCVELLSHTFYGGRGPWVDSLDFWSYDNLIEKTFIKSRNISSSITTLNSDNGPTCLYPQRYEILKMVNTLSFVDSYGDNLSPKRKDALVDYKFNLVIENEYSNNWITEKFYDCILTDTIPIYFGCKNIKEVYPEDGYVLIDDVNDVKSVKDLLHYINENADEIYNKKIKELQKIKRKYFSDYNLLGKIVNL